MDDSTTTSVIKDVPWPLGKPSPGAAPATEATPPATGDWAVCCSGGGIRSATYCLGGLQALEEGALLRRAKWIVGVSGGSYIAASRALVARGLAQNARPDRARDADPGRVRDAGQGRDGGQAQDAGQRDDERPAAYARGTPEEQNLRNNTRYIAPDAKTMLVAVLSLLLGAVVTCLLVLAPLYALSHAWGWLLHGQGVLTWSHGQASASVTAVAWWLPTAIAAGITLVLFLYWWGTLVSGGPGRGQHRASTVGWAATVTAGLALFMLAVPPVIAWLSHSTGALGTVVHFFGFGGSLPRSVAALTGVVAAIATIAGSLQKQLARLRLASSSAGTASGGTIGKIAAWVRAKLTPWLASLVIIAVGAFAILLWIGNAARAGLSGDQLVPVLVAVGVMLGTRAFADINRTSLHDFYRWRLADAYAVTRDAVEADTAAAREELFAKAARTRLSELADDDGAEPADDHGPELADDHGDPEPRGDRGGPKLIIATTANINANREVPPGRGGFCLAFASDKVTLRADPCCGEPNVEAETKDYEYLLGHTRFTLFDVVAISGAAFSPLMGTATRSAYRIVLTLTNLRLGIWMPHPDVVRRARAYLRKSDEDRRRDRQEDRWWARWTFLLLLWYVSQHPFWHRDPRQRNPEKQGDWEQHQKEWEERQNGREDRLWAHVLRLREQSTKCNGWRRTLLRLQAAVCWRVMQPTLGMLWAEAAGHTSYRATWINVTDGGHYDNLGLVEALHRGADNIVVFDASGDRPDTWYTLGGAMALARTDAGAEISLNPTAMVRKNGKAPTLCRGQVLQPWAHGTFTRSAAALARRGGAHAGPNGDGTAGRRRDARSQANGHGADCELPGAGEIWICKLGWWDQAPWDVRAYAAGHSTYPCDPTLQQLYDGAEFEAYHELGVSAVIAAAKAGELPLQLPQR